MTAEQGGGGRWGFPIQANPGDYCTTSSVSAQSTAISQMHLRCARIIISCYLSTDFMVIVRRSQLRIVSMLSHGEIKTDHTP